MFHTCFTHIGIVIKTKTCQQQQHFKQPPQTTATTMCELYRHTQCIYQQLKTFTDNEFTKLIFTLCQISAFVAHKSHHSFKLGELRRTPQSCRAVHKSICFRLSTNRQNTPIFAIKLNTTHHFHVLKLMTYFIC